MLFGVDIMQDNVTETVLRLNATELNHNIVCFDGLAYDYQFGQTESTAGGIIEMPGLTEGKILSGTTFPKKQKNKPESNDLFSF